MQIDLYLDRITSLSCSLIIIQISSVGCLLKKKKSLIIIIIIERIKNTKLIQKKYKLSRGWMKYEGETTFFLGGPDGSREK